MISIRKHIESHSELLLDATCRSYRSVLFAVGRHLARAVPGIHGDVSGNFRLLSEHLESEPTPATVQRLEGAVDSELSHWVENVEQHLKSKASDVREILLVVANTAQSFSSRDKRYASRFREITARLEGIANLDDLSEVRRSLVAHSLELNTDIRDMEAEGHQAVSFLEAKLQDYRRQLAEAERRERADPLTGLVNRRGIEMEIERCREEGRPFCVVMLDLDSFKPVNDTHGHAAGDDLLRQFAGELRPHFRSNDVIGRWGGDEFIVVVRGDEETARTCADGLRKWAFGTYKIMTPKGVCSVPLTASVGIAQWEMPEEQAQLLGRVDASMYAEKRAAGKCLAKRT